MEESKEKIVEMEPNLQQPDNGSIPLVSTHYFHARF